MTLWLLLLGVGTLVFVWSRRAKQARDNWLRALNLLGKWELEGRADAAEVPRRSLTLTGTLSAGKYVARDGDAVERGRVALERSCVDAGGNRRRGCRHRAETLRPALVRARPDRPRRPRAPTRDIRQAGRQRGSLGASAEAARLTASMEGRREPGVQQQCADRPALAACRRRRAPGRASAAARRLPNGRR